MCFYERAQDSIFLPPLTNFSCTPLKTTVNDNFAVLNIISEFSVRHKKSYYYNHKILVTNSAAYLIRYVKTDISIDGQTICRLINPHDGNHENYACWSVTCDSRFFHMKWLIRSFSRAFFAFFFVQLSLESHIECLLIIMFFQRILESLPPLPRQHSAAIGCTKSYQQ